MSDKSAIEWTDATWNPIRGCSRVSEGCRRCYAEIVAARFSGPGQAYEGLARRKRVVEDGTGKSGTVARWTGEVRFVEGALALPLRWRTPRRIFVNSMSDLFHERVPDEWIDRIFAVMALSGRHVFQVLTKRPERMRVYCNDPRRRAAVAGEIRRIGNRPGGANLAPDETRRQPTAKQLRHSTLPKGSGRVSDTRRLLTGDDHNQGQEDDCTCPPGSVDTLPRPDSGRTDREPPRRSEGQQQAVQHGAGDVFGAKTARPPGSQRQSQSAEGGAQPQSATDGSASHRDQAVTCGRGHGEESGDAVRYEKAGRLGDLLSQNLEAHLAWPLPNVWLGVSVEDQATADARIPVLLQTPATVRWVSYEPALGPVDVSRWMCNEFHNPALDCRDHVPDGGLDWLVAGGESSPGARPPHPDWFRSARDQCQAGGIPYLFKQWGEYAVVPKREGGLGRMIRAGDIVVTPDGRRATIEPRTLNCALEGDGVPMRRVGKKAAGALLDGREWREFPA